MDLETPNFGRKSLREAAYLKALDRHREDVRALSLKLESILGGYDPEDDPDTRCDVIRGAAAVLKDLLEEDAALASREIKGAAFIYDLE